MRTRERTIPWHRRVLRARGRSLEITRAGQLFVALTLLVGFAAINTGSNLLHAMFGIQLGLVIASGVLSEAMVRRTTVACTPLAPLHADTPTPLRMRVHNPDRFTVLCVSVEIDPLRPSDATCVPVFAVAVAPQETVELTSHAVLPRRGRAHLPPLVLSTRFPFGLFVKRRELTSMQELVVYPRIRPVEPLRLECEAEALEEHGCRAGRSGEVHGLREYRDGDELRGIHWPATARLARPIVREHAASSGHELMLELARGRSGDDGFERAVVDAASTAVALLDTGLVATGLAYAGTELVPPRLGEAQKHAILRELALVGETS